MSYSVDFVNVSTVGLEPSPVATALAGLRANEARYFKNKYDHVFTVEPADEAKTDIDLVHRILKEERNILITSPPLEATTFHSDLGPLKVTCSVGVAPFPGAGTNWEALFKATDEALYASKRGGRNRVTVWNPKLSGAAA